MIENKKKDDNLALGIMPEFRAVSSVVELLVYTQ